MMKISRPPGLSALADHYDAFVVDLWGVMHDGVTAFPAAIECLRMLREKGKTVVILSNAPRRAESVKARNRELGIEDQLADLVMSSGEVTWRHIKEQSTAFYAGLGRRCHHLGPERDHGLRGGLDLDFVEKLTEADFLLVTGILDNDHDLDHYAGFLQEAKSAGLPLVCANPDLEVIRGGKRELCAGSLAQAYEALGGKVSSHGKPDPAIYGDCLGPVGLQPNPRILAIGDSLRTDMAGAKAAGLSGLFIAGGIHAAALGLDADGNYDHDSLERLCHEKDVQPDAALAYLVW